MAGRAVGALLQAPAARGRNINGGPDRSGPKECCCALHLMDELELKASSFLNFCCGGCGAELKSTERRKSCSACKLARYCSAECQKIAWPTHKELCKEAKALLSLGSDSRKRSFSALAVDCERAVRCLEFLLQPNPKAMLHPLQYSTMISLRNACNRIEHGQMPCEPAPCLNPDCNRPPELVEFANELELREFVITGLCALCQRQAYDDARRVAGPSIPEPSPLATTPIDLPPMVWTGDMYVQVLPGMPLYTRKTIWDAEDRPCWMAGEVLNLRSADNDHLNVTLYREAHQGHDVVVPLTTFRQMAAANDIQIAFALVAEMTRGIILSKVVLSVDHYDTWLPYLQLSRVARLDKSNCAFLAPGIDLSRVNVNVQGSGKAFRMLLMLMHEDTKLRAAGTFDAHYAYLASQSAAATR